MNNEKKPLATIFPVANLSLRVSNIVISHILLLLNSKFLQQNGGKGELAEKVPNVIFDKRDDFHFHIPNFNFNFDFNFVPNVIFDKRDDFNFHITNFNFNFNFNFATSEMISISTSQTFRS